MDVKVTIDGLAEIARKLKLLPQRIGMNAMRRALRKGANVIRDAARQNAKRIDDQSTSEQIVKNITVQGGGRKREKREGGPMIRVGVLGGARDMSKYGELKGAGSGNPGGDTWYWRLLEFGTSRSRAQPFMRPAMDDKAQAAFDAAAAAAIKETDRELAKLR